MKKRNIRKEIKKQFNQHFDLTQLNYQSRVRPVRGKALLYGALSAGGLYISIYAAAYVGWSKNVIPMDVLAKMVWIMMIPTTILGFLVWQIMRNRLEYPIRNQMRKYIEKIETDANGLLWRYAPLWEKFDGTTSTLKRAISQSEAANVEKIDIEDYAESVNKMALFFDNSTNSEWNVTLSEKLENNFKDIR